jgi:hypothetical protein
MEDFSKWIKMEQSMGTGGDTDMDNFILVAHYGSNHDHVYLMKTMMCWEVEPPRVRSADSLTLCKVMKGMRNRVNLSTLVGQRRERAQDRGYD